MKVLLVTFSDNADHQDTLFGMFEQIEPLCDATLLAIRTPKVPLRRSERTWMVDCPTRPGIQGKTFDLTTLLPLLRKIRRERFDVIYFESLHVWNLAVMRTAGKKTKLIHVIHDVIPHDGDRQTRGVEMMYKAVCRRADCIVLRNSRYAPAMTERYGVSPDRVRCVELWRRFPAFTEPRCSRRVLFFGRVNPYKGADNLLAIARLCPGVQFDVVGRVDPQTEETVEQLRREPNVTVRDGYVSDAEMREAFTACDWLALPYRSASQSGIVIDACKYSRPVIAFNVGAIAEQVSDGVNGYLIPSGDIDAFARRLNEAVRMDEESFRRMCRQAYDYGFQKYAASASVARFMDMLNAVCK